MLKIQPFKSVVGFGDDFYNGEYYWSSGFLRSLYGVSASLRFSNQINNTTLTNLGGISWFTQTRISTDFIWAMNTANGSPEIYKNDVFNTGLWTLEYKKRFADSGRGMIGDQKNRLIYLSNLYLGMYDGSANYNTGTVSMTNGSNAVVGVGTTFTSAMVDRRFKIDGETTWYTVSGFTDATHITLDANYTGTTGSKNYTIYTAWNDNWKTLFTTSYSDYCPMDLYESDILIGRKNLVLAIHTNNNDTFNGESSPAFELPSGFIIKALKSGKNGILIGANFNARCALVLWDNISTRSIAPWIWIDGQILSIVPYGNNWIVITTKQILITNGYTAENMSYIVDVAVNSSGFDVLPQGACIMGDYLLIANSKEGYGRNKRGIYIFNIKTKKFEGFAPVLNKNLFSGFGAIYFDNNYKIHVGYSYDNATYGIGSLITNGGAEKAFYITPPLGDGDNQKVAEGIRLDAGYLNSEVYNYPGTITIEAKIARAGRPMFGTNATGTASTQADILKIAGSLALNFRAFVGDEVTIASGLNAGEVRHIKSIANQGTASETWTLDSALPNLTENAITLYITPFTYVGKIDITSPGEFGDLYFPVKNKIKGKKFYVKFLFKNPSNATPIEIYGGHLIYDDLGIL